MTPEIVLQELYQHPEAVGILPADPEPLREPPGSALRARRRKNKAVSNRRAKLTVVTAQPQAKRVKPPKKWWQHPSRRCPRSRPERIVLQERIVALDIREHVVGSEDETFDGESVHVIWLWDYVDVATPVVSNDIPFVDDGDEELARLMEQPPGTGYDTSSGLPEEFVGDLPAGFFVEVDYGDRSYVRQLQRRRLAAAAVVEPDYGDLDGWEFGRFEPRHLPVRV